MVELARWQLDGLVSVKVFFDYFHGKIVEGEFCWPTSVSLGQSISLHIYREDLQESEEEHHDGPEPPQTPLASRH